jgi:hypothetical protein
MIAVGVSTFLRTGLAEGIGEKRNVSSWDVPFAFVIS